MDEMRVNIDYEAERLNGEERHLDLGSRSTMVYETTSAVDMTMATAKLSMADIDYYVRINDAGKLMAYTPKEYAFEASEHIRGQELDREIARSEYVPTDRDRLDKRIRDITDEINRMDPFVLAELGAQAQREFGRSGMAGEIETTDRGPDYMPTAQERVDARFNELMAERARMDPDLLADLGAQAEREFRMSGMAVGPGFRSENGLDAVKLLDRSVNVEYREPSLESDRQIGEDMHRNFGKWSTAIMENGTSHQVNEAQMGLDAVKIDSYIRITEDGKHSLHVPTEYLGDAQKALARDLDRTVEMQPVRAIARGR